MTAEIRATLTRERVLRAAVDLADREGLAALSMRKLGQEVGVEAMSLYNHVTNKDDILDGVTDVIMTEINEAATWTIDASCGGLEVGHAAGECWPPEVCSCATAGPPSSSMRNSDGAPMMRYFDSVIGLLRAGGFLQRLDPPRPACAGEPSPGVHAGAVRRFGERRTLSAMAMFFQQLGDEYPHIVAMLREVTHDADTTLGWCDDQFEFEFALDLLLDGLERLRDA